MRFPNTILALLIACPLTVACSETVTDPGGQGGAGGDGGAVGGGGEGGTVNPEQALSDEARAFLVEAVGRISVDSMFITTYSGGHDVGYAHALIGSGVAQMGHVSAMPCAGAAEFDAYCEEGHCLKLACDADNAHRLAWWLQSLPQPYTSDNPLVPPMEVTYLDTPTLETRSAPLADGIDVSWEARDEAVVEIGDVTLDVTADVVGKALHGDTTEDWEAEATFPNLDEDGGTVTLSLKLDASHQLGGEVALDGEVIGTPSGGEGQPFAIDWID